MLQNCDVPAGHWVGSVAINIVHFTEQIGVDSMSKVFVHTPVAHSVDMSVTIVHG